MLAPLAARGEPPAAGGVVLVLNDRSPLSRTIGAYYARARSIPAEAVCRLSTTEEEQIDRATYDREIAAPVASFLRSRHWVESTFYLITTSGVPLAIRASSGSASDAASVDSELAALYQDLHGRPHPVRGPLPNPFFAAESRPFRHPDFPLYLVARLAGYSFPDVRGMIDRASRARDRGVVVLDARGGMLGDDGDDWLRRAAERLPRARVVLDETARVVEGVDHVIGYASWGSNDGHWKIRVPRLGWLPGAVATEFVSTDARTFHQPPEAWRPGAWGNPLLYWSGSPQTLTADYLHAGATAATGHVFEPYLKFTPRPQILFSAYVAQRRTLGESFYLSIPAVSWMNVLAGDPLCRLARE